MEYPPQGIRTNCGSVREFLWADTSIPNDQGQFEELITNRSNTVNTYTSVCINEDLAPESESDSDDEVPEQIARCNFPGRLRSNRILKTPARLYDYF